MSAKPAFAWGRHREFGRVVLDRRPHPVERDDIVVSTRLEPMEGYLVNPSDAGFPELEDVLRHIEQNGAIEGGSPGAFITSQQEQLRLRMLERIAEEEERYRAERREINRERQATWDW